MGFASFINIITVIFCLAVLVQSVRMMRSLDAVKGSGAVLPQMVEGLDAATARASRVLAELKETLSTDAADNVRVLGKATAIRDELGIMIGIADASADRLIEANSRRDVPETYAADEDEDFLQEAA